MPSQSSTATSPRESRFSIRSVMPAAVVLLSLCGHTVNARASGPEFSWVPVDAGVPYATARPNATGENTEIILAAGTTGQIVEFEVRVSGWGSAPGSPRLGTAGAFLDAAGLLGVNAVPSNPGVDLVPLQNQAWRQNPGGNGLNDGAFMVKKTCHAHDLTNSGIPCESIPDTIAWDPCPGSAPFCLGNEEFVFNGNLSIAEVYTATPNFGWGGVSHAGECTVDIGGSYYLGTLVLNVPGGAKRVYTFGFDPSLVRTLMNACTGRIRGPLRTPGSVNLQDGACCTIQPGGGAPTCADGVLREDCQDSVDIFLIGQACDDPGFTCPSCAVDAHCADGVFCNGVEMCDAANGECLPGSNPCTSFETCDEPTGICRANGACCDRANGTCANNERFFDCRPPLGFQEGVFFCADLPDSDGDGLLDCFDQCPGVDDAVFAPECVGAIPTVSEWGLVVLALTLLALGKICFRRRRRIIEPGSARGEGHCIIAKALLVVGLVALSTRASGPEFSWIPVDAGVPYTTARPNATGEDTEIILAAGTSAEIVEFELRISGWGSAPGAPTLGAAQASLDLSSLLGVNAEPSQPGLDLTLLNNQPWRENLGGNGLNDGAFIVTHTCEDIIAGVDLEIPCESSPMTIQWAPCPPDAPFCVPIDPFDPFPPPIVSYVNTECPDGPCIQWALPGRAGQCTADDGISSYYLGTLVMNVPGDFVGTYAFGFDPAPSATFMNDCAGSAIPDLILTPGHVTLQDGACCTTQPGGGTPTCAGGVFQEDCQGFADIFLLGQACDDSGFTCPSCAVDAHCADGVFCNGAEVCDQANGQCLPGSNPCTPFEACDEPAGICRAEGACCDYLEGRCIDQVLPQDCPFPKTFHAGTLFCADLPDRDGDGVPDCADLCAGLDDTIYAPACVVPTLSAWGMLVLMLMLLAAITIRFGRRRAIAIAAIGGHHTHILAIGGHHTHILTCVRNDAAPSLGGFRAGSGNRRFTMRPRLQVVAEIMKHGATPTGGPSWR